MGRSRTRLFAWALCLSAAAGAQAAEQQAAFARVRYATGAISSLFGPRVAPAGGDEVPAAFAPLGGVPGQAGGGVEAPSRPMLRGFSMLSYQGRANDDTSDSDIYHYLDARVDHLVPGHVNAALTVRQNYDADSSNGRGSPFYSVEDNKEWNHFDLSRAYAEFLAPDWPGASLRLGRQFVEEFESYYLDGATARIPVAAGLGLTIFGGSSVSYYSHDGSDWAAGGAATWTPSREHRARLSYLYSNDGEFDAEDHAFALESWHTFHQAFTAHLRARTLDGNARDLAADISWRLEAIQAALYANVRTLFTAYDFETNHFSPLSRSGLGAWQPHTYGALRLVKDLGAAMSVGVGMGAKRVHGALREPRYSNVDYEEFDLSWNWTPSQRWLIALMFRYRDAELREDTWGITGEARFRPNKQWLVALGSSYDDFRFGWHDPALERAFRQDAELRTYYGRVQYHYNATDYVAVRVDMEDSKDWSDNPYAGVRAAWGRQF